MGDKEPKKELEGESKKEGEPKKEGTKASEQTSGEQPTGESSGQDADTQSDRYTLSTNAPTSQTIMLSGNLIHIEAMKTVSARCVSGLLDIETEAGKVSIKCPIPGAYYVAKDSNGVTIARVMTLEEYQKYATELSTKLVDQAQKEQEQAAGQAKPATAVVSSKRKSKTSVKAHPKK